MRGAESAVPVAVLPGVVQVIVGVVRAAIMADPVIAVDVRDIGMAGLVGVVAVFVRLGCAVRRGCVVRLGCAVRLLGCGVRLLGCVVRLGCTVRRGCVVCLRCTVIRSRSMGRWSVRLVRRAAFGMATSLLGVTRMLGQHGQGEKGRDCEQR
jgi:hypothetical protein